MGEEELEGAGQEPSSWEPICQNGGAEEGWRHRKGTCGRRAEPFPVCKECSINFIMYHFSEQPWQKGWGPHYLTSFCRWGN